MKDSLKISSLKALFICDFPKGQLYWKERGPEYFSSGKIGSEAYAVAWNKRFAGRKALSSINGAGYNHGTIFGKFYLAHRIIFAMYHGYWPDLIDHKNGDTSDNSIGNLIDVSHLENSKNCKKFSHNTSGITGVTWVTSKGKWKAQIKVKGKNLFLGYFSDINMAKKVRHDAEIEHGFSKRHGKAK